MRILLANYRYFVSGGPERYLFAIQSLLEQAGHEVIPFSIRYRDTVDNPYLDYFVEPLAGPDALRFRDHRWTPRTVLRTAAGSIYAPGVARAVDRLVRDTRPDVAYVLHYLKKLSPALIVGLKQAGLPVVVRLSDLLMICPEAHLLRDGKICTRCTSGSILPSIRYKCVQGSRAASLVHYAAWKVHRLRGYYHLPDRFVVPSSCTREWMVNAGYPAEKFTVIPTPVDEPFFGGIPPDPPEEPPYLLYVGHLEHHKGPQVLIEAYARASAGGGTAPRLKIAGRSDTPFGQVCRDLVEQRGLGDRVDFLDFVEASAMPRLYAGALLTVIPSLCYENMPNTLGESYAGGTPVLGSGHGSIAPLIEEGVTGRTFTPGDTEDLAARLREAWDQPDWCREAGRNARAYAEQHLRGARHLDALLGVFRDLQPTGDDPCAV